MSRKSRRKKYRELNARDRKLDKITTAIKNGKHVKVPADFGGFTHDNPILPIKPIDDKSLVVTEDKPKYGLLLLILALILIFK